MNLANWIGVVERRVTKRIIATVSLSVVLFSVPLLLYGGGGPNVSGAKLYIQQNELDKALEVLSKEINEVNANNEDAWYLLGYIYARQGKYDKMKEAFDKAVSLKPEFKDEGVKISKDSGSRFLSQFGTELIARAVWGDAFNAGVKNFNDAVNAPSEDEKKGNYEKAIENFKMAALIMPDSTLAYRNLAAAMLNLGKIEESAQPLQDAIQRNPKDVDSRMMLAQVYMSTGKDSLALPVAEKLWADGQRSEEVAEILARGYIRSGNTEKAKAIYREAIETNPNNFHFRYNYGTILLETNEFDAAIEQLQKAYEIDPASADINYNLGAAYLNRGVAYREKLPDDSKDTSYIADLDKSLPYLEKSIALNPDDQQIWFTLGRIAGQLNKISLAGYSFAKGEQTRSALDEKVIVGMQSDAVLTIFGQPDEKKSVESQQFSGIEEWIYKKRPKSAGKIAVPEPINIYVQNGRVDALMVVK